MSEYKSFQENILYKISMNILEYIVISIFIVLTSVCSLGILFYPSISSSYYYYYQKNLQQEQLPFKRLFTGIKKSYKQAIPLGIFQLLLLYIGYVNINNFSLFNGNTIVYYGFLIGFAFLMIHNFYTLQLITYFEVRLQRAVVLSTYFIIMYLFSTITIIALLVALILSVSINPALIVIILGLFIHVSSKVFMMIFKKHSPEEVNEDEQN